MALDLARKGPFESKQPLCINCLPNLSRTTAGRLPKHASGNVPSIILEIHRIRERSRGVRRYKSRYFILHIAKRDQYATRTQHQQYSTETSLVSLQNGVGDERGRDLASTEPATVKTLDGILGRFNRVELDVDLALRKVN